MHFNPFAENRPRSNSQDISSCKSNRRRSNSLNASQHQNFNIIKPIAVRPHQYNSEGIRSYLSDSDSKQQKTLFTSIDSTEDFKKMNQKITMTCLKNLNELEKENSFSRTEENILIQQRPHLNFIKMKLQQIRIENSENCARNNFFLSFNPPPQNDLRNGSMYFSNISLISSLSSSSIASYKNDGSKSDLDIAQIESDLNY